jgi:hypothetical protein
MNNWHINTVVRLCTAHPPQRYKVYLLRNRTAHPPSSPNSLLYGTILEMNSNMSSAEDTPPVHTMYYRLPVPFHGNKTYWNVLTYSPPLFQVLSVSSWIMITDLMGRNPILYIYKRQKKYRRSVSFPSSTLIQHMRK